MNNYSGYLEAWLKDEDLAKLQVGELPSILNGINENQYIIAYDANGKSSYYKWKNGRVEGLRYPTIESIYTQKIKPLDDYQYCAMDLLKSDTPVKLIRGVYGSGKDYLMFNQALALVQEGKFEKIVFIRPNVTLANVPSIGFLPNGVEEKLGWTMAPLYDKIGGEEGILKLQDEGKFEMVPLLFIRGRSFENSIVYVTEAQNIDSSIAKVLLSRIGEGSELWLNGDNHNQTDSHVFDKDNGFQLMIDKLGGNKLFGYVYLPITHRSEVAKLSSLLD